MQIGIHFGDNDFTITVEAFLDILASGVYNHHNRGITKEERYTKERIVTLFNDCAHSLYWMKQNGFCYQTDWDKAKEYLQIKEKQVYINEEVDEVKYLDMNGEFHWIGL